MKNTYITLLNVILLLLSLFACDPSTKPKTGSLSGRVILVNDTGDSALDPVDYSGITISLYRLAEYDTSLVNIINKHPNLDFQINQNSEFEHQNALPIQKTISIADGSFKLDKVSYGDYNLVLEKNGWGYRYIYNVSVDNKENNLSVFQEQLQLYPEKKISGTISESFEVENWHHLVVEDDTMFLPSSNLSLGPNGFLRINPAVQVNVAGTVKLTGANENMFQIVLNRCDEENDSPNPYTHFNLLSSVALSGDIRNGRFSGGARNLGLNGTDNVNIFRCRFLVDSDGIYANQVSGLNIEQSALTASVTTRGIGTGIYNSYGCSIQYNLFYHMLKGSEVIASNDVQLENNSFIKIDSGVESYDTNTEIRYNYFHENKLAMRLAGTSSPQVNNNQIESEQGITIGKSGYYYNCTPVINNNNFFCPLMFLMLTRPNTAEINAKLNYYYTSDAIVIRSKIRHKPDYPESQQAEIGYFIYEPFRTTKVPNAGIVN